MRRAARVYGGVVAACACLFGCNGVLGIDSAILAPDASSGSEGSSDATAAPSDAGASSPDAESDPLTCANYCKVIAENCTGEFLEYLPASAGGTNPADPCMYLCNNYLSRTPGTYAPPGGPEPAASPGQPGTLACRLWHAHAAGATKRPDIHCRHAGPLGSEACGDPCASFCSLDFSYCVDDNAVPIYSSQMQCQASCIDTSVGDAAPGAGFPYDQSEGDLVDEAGAQINGGNTLNCRIWHLETSIQEGLPKEHCWHTAYPSLNPDGTDGGPCGP